MKTKWKPALLAFFLLAAAGGAWWWQWTGNRLVFAREALPPTPDLSAVPEVLRMQVALAEARVQSRRTAPAGLAELSRLYHANGFLEEAKQCYAGLERLAPTEPRWPHLHATIFAYYGDFEPAMKLWRRVIELAPDYVPARRRLGDSLLKSNRPDEAAAAYTEVLKRSPDDPYALLGLARIDLEAKRWDQARDRLEKVVAQTNYKLGYDLIVSLYEQLGQRERAAAIRSTTKASGAYRDPADPWLDGLIDVCFDPYRLAVAAGIATPDEAVKLLERAIELAPGDVSYRFQLGCIAEAQRNLRLAQENFERCTILTPTFADAWAHLSALHTQQGNGAAALRALLTGLANCPESPGLHLMRARMLQQDGQVAEAINEYLLSLQFRANEPDAYVELGNLLISSGREREGVEQMRRALEADPGDPTALSVITFFTITTNDEAEARHWMTRVSLQPRIPAAQFTRLRDLYRQTFGHDWAPDPKSA